MLPISGLHGYIILDRGPLIAVLPKAGHCVGILRGVDPDAKRLRVKKNISSEDAVKAGPGGPTKHFPREYDPSLHQST